MFPLNITLLVISAFVGLIFGLPAFLLKDSTVRFPRIELAALALGLTLFVGLAWFNVQMQTSVTDCSTGADGSVICTKLNDVAGVQAELYAQSILPPVGSTCLTGNSAACAIVNNQIMPQSNFFFGGVYGYLMMLSMSVLASATMAISAYFIKTPKKESYQFAPAT